MHAYANSCASSLQLCLQRDLLTSQHCIDKSWREVVAHAGCCVSGIAYDSAGKRVFVTGKYWPRLYQIQPVLVAAQPTAAQLTATRTKCISPPPPNLRLL